MDLGSPLPPADTQTNKSHNVQPLNFTLAEDEVSPALKASDSPPLLWSTSFKHVTVKLQLKKKALLFDSE